jgi:hypothetical protein
MLDEAATTMATANKEAMDKRVAEDSTAKAAAAEEVAGKTVDEVAGAIGGTPAPDHAPSVARAKRAVAPSSSTPPAKCPYRGVWKPQFVQLSLLSFFQWGFIL